MVSFMPCNSSGKYLVTTSTLKTIFSPLNKEMGNTDVLPTNVQPFPVSMVMGSESSYFKLSKYPVMAKSPVVPFCTPTTLPCKSSSLVIPEPFLTAIY